ncbi:MULTISPECIES: hypothetical protein [unclassified Bradyrhizobium]|nr:MULTISPECIES: hypothetical protein [unclassified Bradyrhizobium]
MRTAGLFGIAMAVLLTRSAAMNLAAVIKAHEATDKINNLFCIEAQ